MAKRAETLDIENRLHNMCRKKRIYGCEEVTIGFQNKGQGNEIVDFASMDSKGIVRCYEIKVTLPDLKSKAKKSWYGHYNYLAVTDELYEKIKDHIREYIPDWVGVITPSAFSWSVPLKVRMPAKKQELSMDQELMIKESMVRSVTLKMYKYKDEVDEDKIKELKKEVSSAKKRVSEMSAECISYRNTISTIESVLWRHYGADVDLHEVAKVWFAGRENLPETINFKKIT